MDFILDNIAYILLGIGVLYFIALIVQFARARQDGEVSYFRLRYALPFAIIIGLAIYCLVTGQNLRSFIH